MCNLCTASPHVRINRLDYCNACFETQFLHKTQRHFRKLSRGSRVLLYIDESLSSLVMAHVVGRLWSRHLHTFSVLNSHLHTEFFRAQGMEEHHAEICSEGINPVPRSAVDAAEGFDVLVFQADTETEAVMALGSICSGAGLAASLCIPNTKTRVLNVFAGVKPKEILYYHHLHRTEIPQAAPRRLDGVDGILGSFVRRMECKNSLAVFNILNTIRRIVSSRVSD